MQQQSLTELATDVVARLKQQRYFITCVESCTGGGLANAITNISGASEVIKGAWVTYSNDAKIALGVDEVIIDAFTVYSLETAVAMAQAGLEASRGFDRVDHQPAHIAVAITGSISRVDPANPHSTPGEVYIAVVASDTHMPALKQKFVFADKGERWQVKDNAMIAALEMVQTVLKKC